MQTIPPHLLRYADPGLWRGQTIADRARALASEDSDVVALVEGDIEVTVGTLLAEAEALAGAITSLGVRRGETVSFQLPNWREAAAINLAAALGGFVVNPIVPIYRDAEVGYMLRDSRSRLLFFAQSFRGYDYAAMINRLALDLPDLIAAVPVRPANPSTSDYASLLDSTSAGTLQGGDPSAAKLLLYTSGTTGRPKAVLHSHDTLARVITVSAAHWGIGPGDAILMPSPVTHISGYANGLEMPLLGRTRTILMESWDAAAALALIERHRIAGTVAATPFLQELVEQGRRAGRALSSLRVFACGGAAVPPDLIRDANRWFGRTVAFRVYGSSEVPLVTLGHTAPEPAAATDGAIVDYEVKAVADDGTPVSPGAEGELLVRGPAMFLGYANPADTEAALDADGYFRTGDLGIVAADGTVTITGRKKDLIIRGGENISAKEIEDVLHLHPAIAEAAVVAMPHPRLGEGICAVLIGATAERPALDEIGALLQSEGLARQKCPERVVWVDDIPRTASGKIRKDRLREMVRAGVGVSA